MCWGRGGDEMVACIVCDLHLGVGYVVVDVQAEGMDSLCMSVAYEALMNEAQRPARAQNQYAG
ncbi:uncharacterized protein BO80DRAFT_239809 [Aspergillus ibericus CBS 121593]|uniref:Uncharacterized protein n=1 Tax=Aspergillus ibericus CBS 121593 TaxID=1448316 RepID=A0A395GLB5_9EURO|nr:hypothetical protein BO80DRAFT_239809 [Aspergillus ibericus CBS 121593]RAK96184.1 hypothetical protein BO80DRAFT_239809 [Aspergillus ibericus CBS 121593]